MKTVGYAAHDSEKPLEPYHFERRALRDEDVSIEILYCGVCHSDLLTAENDWGWTQYPVVPSLRDKTALHRDDTGHSLNSYQPYNLQRHYRLLYIL